MTEMNSRPIIQRTVVRQATEPNRPLSGMTWINPTGGQNGNNSETYVWNDDAGAWELTRSTGPDTPLNAAAGATWTDTANGTVKNYRAGAWENVGVTDHANLSNLSSGHDHSNIRNPQPNDHRHIEAKRTSGGATEETVSWTSAFGTAPVIGGAAEDNSANEYIMTVMTRSTTGAKVRTDNDDGVGSSIPKHVVAMEGT